MFFTEGANGIVMLLKFNGVVHVIDVLIPKIVSITTTNVLLIIILTQY